MTGALERLIRRAATTTLAQAARVLEATARRALGPDGGASSSRPAARVGEDATLADEPFHFAASDRMHVAVGDVAAVEPGTDGRPPRIVANLMGLVGATPALPLYYSELQLQRRRARDRSMADFYNLIDHRALSFFYRAEVKHDWLLGYERDGGTGRDPVSAALLALEGFAAPGTLERLGFDEAMLTPLAGRLSDRRRPAGTVEAVLRHVTGLDIAVREAVPTWMPLPADEQTRVGTSATRRFARLGESAAPGGEPDAAVLGAAVLDVQHHFEIVTAPMAWPDFLACATGGALLRDVRDACRIATGIEQRPTLRLRVDRDALPPVRLGGDVDWDGAPAVLGRTSWLGSVAERGPVLDDCAIPVATPDPIDFR